MTKITSLEGIGSNFHQKLERLGITTVEALLLMGASRMGRREIAKLTEVEENQVLIWVNRADLFRIKGIGARYASLLENVGVDSVSALAQRNPEHLLQRMEEINLSHQLVRSMPYLKQVSKWIGRARDLPKVVQH